MSHTDDQEAKLVASAGAAAKRRRAQIRQAAREDLNGDDQRAEWRDERKWMEFDRENNR